MNTEKIEMNEPQVTKMTADLPEAHYVHAHDEKRGSVIESIQNVPEELKVELEASHMDPYTPFPIDPLQPVETRILTVRAMVIGAILGALVNASNLYLGLKTGWTFSANMFGAIFGFAIIRFFSMSKIPGISGHFGPMENNIVQTSATAAGGLGIIFVSAIPAIYSFNLFGDDLPKDNIGKLICFTAVSAYFGMCFSVPLRKFFIIHLAKELSLVFPTATATAFTIQSMHVVGSGAAQAKKKIRALAISFAGAFGLRVASQYATGILWDWHIFWWIYQLGYFNNAAINLENWGWYLEFTPAFIGSGMLVGLNAALSFFGGSVLAWGIIGPILLQKGVVFGKPYAGLPEEAPGYMNYISLGSAFTKKNHPSARYWLLWPGVLLMMVTSFVELGVNYKVIGKAFGAAGRSAFGGLHGFLDARGKSNAFLARQAAKEVPEDFVEDPSPPEDQVPVWMWLSGAITCIVFTIVVLTQQFRFTVGLCFLSLLLAFLFTFLAIQCTGATDTTPITTVSKASQLIVGGATKGMGLEQNHAKLLNLTAGAVSAGAASQASDLVNDFKVGFLLRTPPRTQWYAQALGSIVAVFLAPGLFILFTDAYPCIINNADECAFSAPSLQAWKAVATAMTDPTFPIPPSSGFFAIAFSIFGGLVVLLRHFLAKSSRPHLAKYVPNMMIVGLGFLLPQTVYGTAMCMGAIVSHFWKKKNPVSFEVYCFAVAAGLIAGEGIGGVVNALFQVVNIGGDKYGSGIGCPGFSC